MSEFSAFGDLPVEHQQLRGLASFWRERASGGKLPWWRDFHPELLKPWMGHLVVYGVETAPRRYYVRLFGTQVVGYFGRDLSRMYLDDALPAHVRPRMLAPLDECCEQVKPVYDGLVPPVPGSSVHFLHRLYLPFGSDEWVSFVLEAVYIDGWMPGAESDVFHFYRSD